MQNCGIFGGAGLKFVEALQIHCDGEENGCYVLCDGDYHESYAFP